MAIIENIVQILIKVEPKSDWILAWELLARKNELILPVIYSGFTKFGQLSSIPGKALVYCRHEKTTSAEEIKFKNLASIHYWKPKSSDLNRRKVVRFISRKRINSYPNQWTVRTGQ